MKIRQLIFSILLLVATVARAQFHSVDWSAVRCDSLLPVCTQVVELPPEQEENFQMLSPHEDAQVQAAVDKLSDTSDPIVPDPEPPVTDPSVTDPTGTEPTATGTTKA